MESQISELRSVINDSDNIVFFGGAGVSTESGIPDFRSTDGLYNQKYAYPPETMLSHSFFMENTAEFYRFYRDKMIYPDAKPNAAHFKLAELESQGKLKAVVTQNIDSLHQTAGSRCVHELHGSVHRNFCMTCKAAHPLEHILESGGVPRCVCDGIVKPDVVLYEEPLDQNVLEEAVSAIRDADVLIVGGTSLNVYPAAGLLQYYRGNKLILINKSELSCERNAALVIRGKIGEVLERV
ncbi:MAG: NAD-dependent protein deacylase [Methanomassiliicoccaceae archaeon]|nr:NAD-dependent protein deacylase [Methanomassiliicoccaceae archaeon]MCL2145601.1 NAD-dependent protein deacylase [Methanomassiliicoccaceae archaeon]